MQGTPLSSTVQFDQLPDSAFIRIRQLLDWRITPFSTATLWRRIQAGQCPEPVRLSGSITAWRVKDIRAWLAAPSSYGRHAHATRQRSGGRP
jgi:predicted DNA-binding transcriptional regulator AlpA